MSRCHFSFAMRCPSLTFLGRVMGAFVRSTKRNYASCNHESSKWGKNFPIDLRRWEGR